MKNFQFNFLAAIAIFSFFSLASCGDMDIQFDSDDKDAVKVEGNGDVETQTREIADFENLEVSHHFNVVLEQGEEPSLVIEAESNLLEYVVTEVENGTLKLKRKKGFRFKTKNTPKIYVTMTTLKEINFSGAGTFKNKGVFEAENVAIHISGGVDMDLNFDCESLSTSLSGAADFEIEGSADRFSASTSGAGSIDAEDFITEVSKVSVSGAASIKVHATEKVEAHISGVGSVRYGGNPKTVDKHVSGLGSIRAI